MSNIAMTDIELDQIFWKRMDELDVDKFIYHNRPFTARGTIWMILCYFVGALFAYSALTHLTPWSPADIGGVVGFILAAHWVLGAAAGILVTGASTAGGAALISDRVPVSIWSKSLHTLITAPIDDFKHTNFHWNQTSLSKVLKTTQFRRVQEGLDSAAFHTEYLQYEEAAKTRREENRRQRSLRKALGNYAPEEIASPAEVRKDVRNELEAEILRKQRLVEEIDTARDRLVGVYGQQREHGAVDAELHRDGVKDYPRG